jgi:hypothetical protein
MPAGHDNDNDNDNYNDNDSAIGRGYVRDAAVA